jgi:hypothetical protein
MTETGSVQLPFDNRRFALCSRSEMKTEFLTSKIPFPTMMNFSRDDLFLTKFPTGNEKLYKQIDAFSTEGNSQMCLLLAEMFFICSVVPPEKPATIIYLGAHPGDHINFLARFFTNCTFRLYDFIRNKNVMNKIGLDPFNGKQLSNINKIAKLFSDEEAREIKRECPENLYIISDIRNTRYDVRLSPVERAEIIDEDMYKQLEWCQILEPKYALLKYRPKRDDEMVTIPKKLSKDGDSDEKKKAYYYYPDGDFIHLPFQKGRQENFYFMTNKYQPSKEYYHKDMNSASHYHHGFTRTVAIYPNPFEKYYGLYRALIGIEDVKEAAASISNINIETFQPHYYCFGCKWDARAAIYIFLMYLRYMKIPITKGTMGIDDKYQKLAVAFLVKPFILMRENALKDASEVPSYETE